MFAFRGHCMTMGTASTMAAWLKRSASDCPQRGDSSRGFTPLALAHAAGRRIVEMVRDDVRITRILTRHAFENAIRVNGAVGGSTTPSFTSCHSRTDRNEGHPCDWDHLGREVPTLLDLMPSGRFLMEDFITPAGCRDYFASLATAT